MASSEPVYFAQLQDIIILPSVLMGWAPLWTLKTLLQPCGKLLFQLSGLLIGFYCTGRREAAYLQES